MKRVNVLLENLDSYEEHHDRVVRVCEIGQRLCPETFAALTVQVAIRRSTFYGTPITLSPMPTMGSLPGVTTLM